jgi:hypothetical protein
MYLRSFFNDSIFFKKYLIELNKINNVDFIKSLYNNEYKSIEQLLQKEFFYVSEKESLLERQKYIKKVYNPVKPLYAYLKDDSLIYANSYLIPIIITSCNSNEQKIILSDNYLPPKSRNSIMKFKKTKIEIKEKEEIYINYKFLGTNKKLITKAIDFYDNK